MKTSCNIIKDDINPEIKLELEKLNEAASQINDFENKLITLRNTFCETLSNYSLNLSKISDKVGAAIPKARPYFELKRSLSDIQRESHLAAARYESACIEFNEAIMCLSKHELLAKERKQLDNGTMEILNYAIVKVNMSRKEKIEAQKEHERNLLMYANFSRNIDRLQKKRKSDIKKAMEFFRFSKFMDEKLQEQKLCIEIYEEKVRICKSIYRSALERLEDISNKIHEERKKNPILKYYDESKSACHEELSACQPNSRKKEDDAVAVKLQSVPSVFSTSRPKWRPSRPKSALVLSTPIIDGLVRATISNRSLPQIFDRNQK